MRSLQSVPPLLLRRLRQQRDVLRHDAGREAEIGVGVALGGVAELDARRALSALASSGEFAWRHLLATSRTRATTSSSGSRVDGLTFGNSEPMSQTAGADLAARRRRHEIAGDEGDLGVRFAPPASRRRPRRRRRGVFAD